MEKSIRVYKCFDDHEKAERAHRLEMTPEQRLDEVEILRLEGGKFLYEYPARLRRVVTVTQR